MWMIMMMMMFSTCLHLCHIFIGSSKKLLYWKSVTLLMTPITEPRGHSVKRLKSSTIKTILYFLSLVQIWTESRNLDLLAIAKHCKMHNKYIWHKDSQKGYRRGSHWQEFRSREEITHIFSLELENCIFKSMNSWFLFKIGEQHSELLFLFLKLENKIPISLSAFESWEYFLGFSFSSRNWK